MPINHERQREYWEQVAKDKIFTTPFQFDLFSTYVARDAKILDFGCGYGRTLNELRSRNFYNLYGIDFSNNMISRAEDLYPEIDFIANDGQSIPFEDDYFDAVILLAVLTCIVEDKDQNKLIYEIKRVLKPGGVFYVNDFLLNQDDRNLKRYERFTNKYNKYGVFELTEGVILRHHDMDWIRQLLIRFNQLAMKEVVYTTMNGNKSSGFYYLGENKNYGSQIK